MSRYARHVPDTCQWIAHNKSYRYWLLGKGPPILVCTGSVGCGKSMTASVIVHDLEVQARATNRPCLHYFVDTLRNRTESTEEILRALIKQSLDYSQIVHGSVPANLGSQIRAICTNTRQMPDFTALSDVLAQFRSLLPACLFVIDGIDALPENEVVSFLKFLRIHFTASDGDSEGSKVLVFCRETLGRGFRVADLPQTSILQVTLEHIQPDLYTYVEHKVEEKQKGRTITGNLRLIEQVKNILKGNSEKMFLWIHLQLANLWDPNFVTCDQDIQDQLCSLPQGLEDVYLQCLRRIDSANDGRSRDIAPMVFRWIATAKTPLNDLQAREAISMASNSLPLRATSLLNLPVTDFCANLVEIDVVDGTIKFPHRTVKEFLLYGQLPPDLQKYSLNPNQDDLWCGQLCLAYAKMHHSRNAVVTYRKQEVDPELISVLVQDTVQQSLPLSWTRLWRSRGTSTQPLRLPMPTKLFDGHLLGRDYHLHNYMCRHWLSHNRLIKSSDSGHESFAELCLAEDADIQPWTFKSSESHTQLLRMLEFAVMDNNPALLTVVRDRCHSINPKDTESWTRLANSLCPGTDSTFLHVAVALGHAEIVALLLCRWSRPFADGEGKSAAAVAIELGHRDIINFLIVMYPSLPIARLWSSKNGRSKIAENIFNVCAARGDMDTAQLVWDRISSLDSPHKDDVLRGILSDAFFHACVKSQRAMAAQLLVWGANPDILNVQGKGVITDNKQWRSVKQHSSLYVALRRKDFELQKELIIAGADAKAKTHPGLEDVFFYFKGELCATKKWADNIVSSAKPDFLRRLYSDACQMFRDSVYRRLSTKFQEERLSSSAPMYDLDDLNPFRFPLPRAEEVQLMLLPYCDIPNVDHSRYGLKGRLPENHSAGDKKFQQWLDTVNEDVFLHTLRHMWIKDKFLQSDMWQSFIMSKGSVKFLASVLVRLIPYLRHPIYDEWLLQNESTIIQESVDYETLQLQIRRIYYFGASPQGSFWHQCLSSLPLQASRLVSQKPDPFAEPVVNVAAKAISKMDDLITKRLKCQVAM